MVTEAQNEPRTAEQQIAALIEGHIEAWVEQGYRIACATVGTVRDEPAMRKGFDQMRHLHLAEPWLPARDIALALVASGVIRVI